MKCLKYKEVAVAQNNPNDKVKVLKNYYKSGALKVESPRVNGEIHGIEKMYYESGALLAEVPYVNGKQHGIVKRYYESGALQWEFSCVNGKMQGVSRVYFESGALKHETPYVNGREHGVEKHYDKDKLNIARLTLYRRSHEVLTLRRESYGAVSTRS
jgi:antitoxin component YwqK of YwqJK toxin-antitoxin module